MEPEWLLFLFLVAVCAGWIDTIAGGGGLLALPALLFAGLDPATTIATNKLQGTAGTLISSQYFIRKKIVSLNSMKTMIATTFIGSIFGSWIVLQINPVILTWILPFLLIATGLYVLLSQNFNDSQKKQILKPLLFALSLAPLIGLYDGFFGPGTGSFLALAFVSLLGFGLSKATAHAKVLNFTSNVASLLFFISFGNISWIAGSVMICGQLIGASLGAKTVLKKGASLIKPILVSVCFSLSLYILAKQYILINP
jgi:hypothetical protein